MVRQLHMQGALVTGLALFLATATQAQILVPNPGFETQTNCPEVSEIEKAPPWNSPSLGTPDLYNSTCPTQNPPGRTGIGSSGVFTYSTFPNNREYIQAPLVSPLVGGQGYCVSFYVARTNHQLGADRIGAFLGSGALSLTSTAVITEIPQIESPAGTIITASSWTLVSGQFIASGGEDHIIIGNFRNDAGTQTEIVNAGSTNAVAYYRIDDISLEACAVGIAEVFEPGLVELFPQPAIDRLSIRFPGAWPVGSIQLVGTDGRTVHNVGAVAQRHGLVEMDLGDIAPGMYVLVMHTPQGTVSKRVQVQR